MQAGRQRDINILGLIVDEQATAWNRFYDFEEGTHCFQSPSCPRKKIHRIWA